jgi:hypothetical protein
MDLFCSGVAARTGVAKENALTPPSERERGRETSGTPTDDHHVVRHAAFLVVAPVLTAMHVS